ncbi:MAG: hypothetical protein V9G25_05310 [Acidimicrobiia bacterium]
MIVSAPASSANIGPGFDSLGLAVDVNFSIALNEQPRGGFWEPAKESHPAIVAYKKAGGVTELKNIWLQSHIPYARGMGFSGATRVAGAYSALIQNGEDEINARDLAFRIAGDLEGHDDNAAPSAYGGFCVTVGGHVIRFDCKPEEQGLNLVIFRPDVTTSTKESRTILPNEFPKIQVVENIGNVAMLVAMLAGNTFNDEVLKIVTEDNIHQPSRLAACIPSKLAYDRFRSLECSGTWLSGSGPSVAAFVDDDKLDETLEEIKKLNMDAHFKYQN